MDTPTTVTLKKSSRRRWYQYSLRTLLAGITVVCVGTAFVVNLFVVPAQRQKRAVQAIHDALGGVEYDDQPKETVLSSAPEWLRNRLGQDYFKNVIVVKLSGSQITDADLEHVEHLTQLQTLDLFYANISNEGLRRLKTLAKLQSLDLRGTKINDAGLANLKELTNLRTLRLDGTQISDAGLQQLDGLMNLEMLTLSGTAIGDAGLPHLNGLTNLKHLDLSGTQITEQGLDKIKNALLHCQISYPPNFAR